MVIAGLLKLLWLVLNIHGCKQTIKHKMKSIQARIYPKSICRGVSLLLKDHVITTLAARQCLLGYMGKQKDFV